MGIQKREYEKFNNKYKPCDHYDCLVHMANNTNAANSCKSPRDRNNTNTNNECFNTRICNSPPIQNPTEGQTPKS